MQTRNVASLADGLASLAIDNREGFEVYEVDWRTKVLVDGDEEAANTSRKGDVKAGRPNVSSMSWSYLY